MYRVLHTGLDTLDIAFQAALPQNELDRLEEVRVLAETSGQDQPCQIGPGDVAVFVKSHGQRGGYRYVITNGPTGAIFSIKANANANEWNLFVSVRALRLLTLGYQRTKLWLVETLASMGFEVAGYSVHRFDFAIDLLSNDFVLNAANIVCPAQAKVNLFWSKEQLLGDDGNVPHSVLRGRSFESVTIGRMPNRQVIIYDKRRAAIALRQPYWFDAWSIDRDDLSAQVWRVEIRAGRDALSKRLLRRDFEGIEGVFKAYCSEAVEDIRYLATPDVETNITRTEVHPLWQEVHRVVDNLPVMEEPRLPEAHVLSMLRIQRRDMAEKQAFGNLINALVLEGLSPDEIARSLPAHAARYARRYANGLGEASLLDKAQNSVAKQGFLLRGAAALARA